MTLTNDNFSELYVNTVRYVRDYGRETRPRGMLTYEVPAMTLHLTDTTRAAMPYDVGRKMNPAVGAVEALQLIGGVQHPEIMTRITPNFRLFMDGGTFHGGYGTRTRGQLPAVCDRLRKDRDTRQALLTIWSPLEDLHVDGVHDYPCTVFLQFFIRDGKLEMHTHMRSNDVWWGLAYDAFQFTQLQWSVAYDLGVDPGSYFHHAASMHVYEKDLESIEELHFPMTEAPIVRGIGSRYDENINMISEVARGILAGRPPAEPSVSEEWYIKTLSEYV